MDQPPSVWVYTLAYILSILRLPFGIAPYFGKLVFVRLSRGWLEQHWDDYPVQLLRALGDATNVIATLAFFYLTPTLGQIFIPSIIAETVRFVAEKGVMAGSALWQALPHRRIARRLARSPLRRLFRRYYVYYRLSDEQRLALVYRKLQAYAACNTRAAQKLRYVNGFRIVPDGVRLACGDVRDVVHGEIYVHARWTNQPDLLLGLALRRSPWIFDPRQLERPFYYRTRASRLMTLTVFEHAALCPWYAVYQFGHDVKTARYDAFYRVLGWFGVHIETPVRADGTYAFEPLAVLLRLAPSGPALRPLWTDDEVLDDLTLNADDGLPTALEIAQRYTYPLLYVEEVLLPKAASLRAQAANASQTA